MKKILSLALVLAMLSLSVFAMASCSTTPTDTTTGATTTVATTTVAPTTTTQNLSVSGKTYEIVEMGIDWAAGTTAEDKATTYTMMKMMLEQPTLSDEAAFAAFAAMVGGMEEGERQIYTFNADGTMVATMTQPDHDPQTMNGTWTQTGAEVSLTMGEGEYASNITLVCAGDTMTAESPLGSEMFPGLVQTVTFQVVAD